MLLKLTPPVVYLSRAATPSTTVRTLVSRGGDAGPEHANCCSKAAFLPSLTVVVDIAALKELAAGKSPELCTHIHFVAARCRTNAAILCNSSCLPKQARSGVHNAALWGGVGGKVVGG